jgi:hypothetical protein
MTEWTIEMRENALRGQVIKRCAAIIANVTKLADVRACQGHVLEERDLETWRGMIDILGPLSSWAETLIGQCEYAQEAQNDLVYPYGKTRSTLMEKPDRSL